MHTQTVINIRSSNLFLCTFSRIFGFYIYSPSHAILYLLQIYIFKAIEDGKEAEPNDKNADVDSDSAQEVPDQTDSPVSEPPSSPEPLKGAKRRKLRGRR